MSVSDHVQLGELSHQHRHSNATRTNSRSEWTPEDFARAIQAYAAQTIATTLTPGEEYGNLARYLMRSLEQGPSGRALPAVSQDHHATLYRFKRGEPRVEKTVGFDQQGLSSIVPSSSSSLLFLHGYQSPECLTRLGAWWRLDPAFLQQHLRFKTSFGGRELFSTPKLPSVSEDIVKLVYITIGTRDAALETNIQRLRNESVEAMDAYLLNINIERDIKAGDSVVRAYNVHDVKYFSIQQEMTISVQKSNGGWQGVVWLDSGHDLDKGPRGPWRSEQRRESSWKPSFLPTIQHARRIAFKWQNLGGNNESMPLNAHSQSASRLGRNYGCSLDSQIAVDDAFYAMTEVMKFSAFSISQFLNLVERQIVPIPDAHVIRSGKHDMSYLSYHEQMLEDLITTLRDNIRTIRARGGQGWPSLKEGPGTEQTAKSANALLLDFSELLRRAEILAKKCRSNMIMTMTQASIAESQRAIAQAVRVEQLTRLASFFLPLSFSASLLGMNMELFGQGTIPVWVWFAISVPIGGLTFLMLKLMSLRATS